MLLRLCSGMTSLAGRGDGSSLSPDFCAAPIMHEHLTIISGRAHPKLAAEIATFLGIELGRVDIWNFPDGEIGLKLDQNIRGRDVFIVQPPVPPSTKA